MLCHHCNENEATYRFYVNYMGQMGEVHLCEDCMAEIRQYTAAFYQAAQENGEAVGEWWKRIPGFVSENTRALGADPFPLDAGADVKQRRRLNQLHTRLRSAVEQENFEKAAQLRDEIIQIQKGVFIYDAQ